MRARMKIPHRAARFGPHQLYTSDVIYTEGDRGAVKVSMEEMRHHLEHGHAEPLKTQLEAAKPPKMETAALEVDLLDEEPDLPEEPEKAPAKKGHRKG